MVTAGEGKAGAVAMALGGAGEVAMPAVGAVGTARTLWLMDRDAACEVALVGSPAPVVLNMPVRQVSRPRSVRPAARGTMST